MVTAGQMQRAFNDSLQLKNDADLSDDGVAPDDVIDDPKLVAQ